MVGIGAATTDKDSIITSYRDHCTHLVKGGTLLEVNMALDREGQPAVFIVAASVPWVVCLATWPVPGAAFSCY
jgi:hypothetical protein